MEKEVKAASPSILTADLTSTVRKPWLTPQIMETKIRMTENGGGYNIDIALQDVDLSS